MLLSALRIIYTGVSQYFSFQIIPVNDFWTTVSNSHVFWRANINFKQFKGKASFSLLSWLAPRIKGSTSLHAYKPFRTWAILLYCILGGFKGFSKTILAFRHYTLIQLGICFTQLVRDLLLPHISHRRVQQSRTGMKAPWCHYGPRLFPLFSCIFLNI